MRVYERECIFSAWKATLPFLQVLIAHIDSNIINLVHFLKEIQYWGLLRFGLLLWCLKMKLNICRSCLSILFSARRNFTKRASTTGFRCCPLQIFPWIKVRTSFFFVFSTFLNQPNGYVLVCERKLEYWYCAGGAYKLHRARIEPRNLVPVLSLPKSSSNLYFSETLKNKWSFLCLRSKQWKLLKPHTHTHTNVNQMSVEYILFLSSHSFGNYFIAKRETCIYVKCQNWREI